MCGAEKGRLSYNLGVSLKPGKQVQRLLDTARAPGRLSSRCAVMTIAEVAFVGTAAPASCGQAENPPPGQRRNKTITVRSARAEMRRAGDKFGGASAHAAVIKIPRTGY